MMNSTMSKMRQRKVGRKEKGQDVVGSSKKNIPCETESDDIFPLYSPLLVCLVTLVIRINYVSQRENWWILHPDEIYQSLEVAHAEIYGYGFRPYEYLTNIPCINDSRIRQRELQLGMAAMRSFIYPGYFIMISHLVELMPVTTHPFLVWKISHVCITSTLPLVMFLVAKQLFRSRDVGVMSSLLVATSVHLNVFGTHTLVNSFLAPFVFMSLSGIIYSLRPDKIYHSIDKEDAHLHDVNRHRISTPSLSVVRLTNSFNKMCSFFKSYHFIPSGIHGLKKRSEYSTPRTESKREENVDGQRERDLPWICWTYVRYQWCSVTSSFILTTCCYIRPDLTMFSLVMLGVCIRFQRVLSVVSLHMGCGSIISLIWCISCDFLTYGFGVISPWNWFYFNIWKHYSAALFGRMGVSLYCYILLLECPIHLLLVILATAILCYMYTRGKHMDSVRVIVKLLLALVIILFIYSLQYHKEPRHIHNVFCLFYVVISGIFISFLKSTVNVNTSRILLLLCSVLIIASAYQQFPSPKNKSNISWVYGRSVDSNDVNVCLKYVGSTNDVTGVFMDRSIHMSGGYSLLHKDVPMLVLLIHEFNEHNNLSRINVRSSFLSSLKTVYVSMFSRVANFISIHNTRYLLKYLINNPKYNYLIMPKSRQFIDFGYKRVFDSGSMMVLRRTFQADDETKLITTARRIPIGINATVLNYEGNWLFDMGAIDMAAERLNTSHSIDVTIINNYQVLSDIYFIRGNKQGAINIMKKCYDLYDKDRCMKFQKNKVLHSIYDLHV